MKIRSLLFILILVAVSAFAMLNWNAFLAPTTLSLGVADIQTPLGLVMLGVLVFVAVIFLVFVVYLQGTVLLDGRQHAKELQSNRKLADQAEASRFTELRNFLEAELQKQAAQNAEIRAALMERLDLLNRELRVAVEQSGNSLAASLGEMEDKLDRGNKDVTHNLLA
jgi:Na+-transporting methylmalonyl-CoA/oxaloacetate decarboxylase gamma subunit